MSTRTHTIEKINSKRLQKIKKRKKIQYDVDKFGWLNCFDDDLLCAVVRGEIDLNQIASNMLSQRGLDENGKWIGFDAAKRKLLKNE